jgi:hypothetical protein
MGCNNTIAPHRHFLEIKISITVSIHVEGRAGQVNQDAWLGDTVITQHFSMNPAGAAKDYGGIIVLVFHQCTGDIPTLLAG